MKNIKRYDVEGWELEIYEDRKGDWIKYNDYLILYANYFLLLDEIKELTKENGDLKTHCYLTGGHN